MGKLSRIVFGFVDSTEEDKKKKKPPAPEPEMLGTGYAADAAQDIKTRKKRLDDAIKD